MTKRILCVSLALAIGLFTALPAQAAKRQNRANGERQSARMLSRFDADNSGSIDTTEAQRVRTAFETLKALDTDHDGQLSDAEIAAAKVAPKPQGKRAGKRARKTA